jgi:hypothetical protein
MSKSHPGIRKLMLANTTLLALSVVRWFGVGSFLSAVPGSAFCRLDFSRFSASNFFATFLTTLGLHDVRLTDSHFSQFLSTAVSVRGASFQDIQYVNRSIVDSATNLTISSCSFVLCRRSSSIGRAIEIQAVSLRATSCTFRQNSADCGAAVGATEGRVEISDCQFFENWGQTGGCVALRRVAVVVIEEATFYLNCGVMKGSSLLCENCPKAVVKSSKFVKNRAEDGATICAFSSSVYFSWDVFEVNRGSPVSAIQSAKSRLTIRKTQFSDGRRHSITMGESDMVTITLCRFVGSIGDQIHGDVWHLRQRDNIENLTMPVLALPVLRNLPVSGVVEKAAEQGGADQDDRDTAGVSLPIIVMCVAVVSIVGACALSGKGQVKKPRVREDAAAKIELGNVEFCIVPDDNEA